MGGEPGGGPTGSSARSGARRPRPAPDGARRDWIVAQVEAKSGTILREMVGEALHDNLVDLARPGVGTRVVKALKTALSFKASYDVQARGTSG